MKMRQFLEHHGIAQNPFDDEDAQTDSVFREHCISSTYHPAWDKIYGNPSVPATAVVFGEKGAGKTALRLQIARQLAEHNAQHPTARVFVIEYDDFNQFLGPFCDRVGRGSRSLQHWKLWDHLDALLSVAVTRLVARAMADDRPTEPLRRDDPLAAGKIDLARLSRSQARDLLLLTACYDQSSADNLLVRWRRLKRRLHYSAWSPWWPWLLAVLVTLLVPTMILATDRSWFGSPWPYVFVALGWMPWLMRRARWWWVASSVRRHLRSLRHETGLLSSVLASFPTADLARQPLPRHARSDDRYDLLSKLESILAALGYSGVIVLVDRIDEPELIGGKREPMRELIWPLLDNKLLKRDGLGFKLLLPIELLWFVEREEPEFFQKARLDKQNLIRSLEWSGAALYDVASDRMRACAIEGQQPRLEAMFHPSMSKQRLMDAFASLRVPRHLFKFLHRVLVEHCNAHTDDNPEWQVSAEIFERELGLYKRDQDAFDRGMGAG